MYSMLCNCWLYIYGPNGKEHVIVDRLVLDLRGSESKQGVEVGCSLVYFTLQ